MAKNFFTPEELAEAKQTSLTALARSMGYTPVRCGTNKFKLKEMDSLMIYNDQSWFRWSQKGTHIGGSQIDFLLEFGTCDTVADAVHELLSFQGISPEHSLDISESYKKAEEKAKSPFILPEAAPNYRRMYAYLMKIRGLSSKVINYMVKEKLIYEENNHHNIVFIGRAPDGTAKYAAMRGTADIYGKKFKGDVEGNDKSYGVNIINPASPDLKVFESTIDCMSYMDLTDDYTSNKLVLGMLADNPLEKLLQNYKHIKTIDFCLDNDDAAGKELPKYTKKYLALGYQVMAHPAPDGNGKCKDYNEYLQLKKTVFARRNRLNIRL